MWQPEEQARRPTRAACRELGRNPGAAGVQYAAFPSAPGERYIEFSEDLITGSQGTQSCWHIVGLPSRGVLMVILALVSAQ